MKSKVAYANEAHSVGTGRTWKLVQSEMQVQRHWHFLKNRRLGWQFNEKTNQVDNEWMKRSSGECVYLRNEQSTKCGNCFKWTSCTVWKRTVLWCTCSPCDVSLYSGPTQQLSNGFFFPVTWPASRPISWRSLLVQTAGCTVGLSHAFCLLLHLIPVCSFLNLFFFFFFK